MVEMRGEILKMVILEGPIEKVTFEQNTYRGEGMNLWLPRKGFIDLNFKIA